MGRRRMRRRSTRHERKIEHRQWFTNAGFTGADNVTLKAGNDTDNLLKVFVDPLKGDDQTILRTRGYVAVDFGNPGVPVNAVLGMTVLPDKTAENASESDLPNPMVDADSNDWFVWQPFLFPKVNTTDSSGNDDVLAELAPHNLVIDSKAKRILQANESVVAILGLGPEAAINSKSLHFAYSVRTLVGY